MSETATQTVIQLSPDWTITLVLDEKSRQLRVAVASPFDSAVQDCQFVRTTMSPPGSSAVGINWGGADKDEVIHVDQSGVMPNAIRKRKFSAVGLEKDLNGDLQSTTQQAIVPLNWANINKKARVEHESEPPLFMNLPTELQLHIFSFVPPYKLAFEVQLVCSHWRRLAQDESLWRVVHRGLWDGPKLKEISWKKDCLQVVKEVQYRNDLHATKMLLWAAQRGYLGLIKHLLQHYNITVNACNKKKVTALLVAAEVGHAKVVEFLLERRADVEAAASKNATSLYMASQHGHIEVVRMLLKAGANVNAKTDYGTTALFVAAQMGNTGLVSLLLSNGADVNIPMNNAQTPLFVAVREGHLDIVRMLLTANADVNAERSDGTTSLVMAAYKGNIDIVKLLVMAGANVNAAPQGGMNALFVASQQGALDVVQFLLENTNSAIDVATAGGTTPLLISTQKGHTEVVKLLLRHGANIKARLKDGTTARVIAEASGFTALANLLRAEETQKRMDCLPGGQKDITPMQM